MKKRLLVLALAIVSCLALAFGLTACNKKHEHDWLPTCVQDGDKHYQICSGCSEKKYSEHSYNEWGYCVCGKIDLSGIGGGGGQGGEQGGGEQDTALHGVELKAEGFERDGLTLYKEVSSETETISFRTGIEVAEGALYRIYSDLQCKNEIASKSDTLVAGNNVFYLLITNGNDLEIYTVTVRRIPVYTVSFITDGSTIEPQSVEEGKLAQQPTQAVTRTGYTFVSWDYDFNKPVTENVTVTALWKAKDYIITFDVNGGDNLQSNTQTVTYNGDYTLPVPTRTGYTFEGWYVDETKLWDDLSWHIASNVTATAKWKADIYRVAVSCGSNGSVTGSGNYEYNSTVTLTATPYLGYSLVGWYEGEQLVCSENTYSVTVPDGDVSLTVRFQVVESMQGFEFTSTQTSCTITDVKDKAVTEITIPNFVTGIGKGVFRDSGLKSIVIPDSVTSIGDQAFYECSGLTSVTIGNGVTSIGDQAFYECSGLTIITYTGDLARWCAIDGLHFLVPYGKREKTLTINGQELKGELIIPDSVTSIGGYVFSGCGGLTSVTIGNSVTMIGGYAFYGCSGLTSVTLPDSVTSIGGYAFYGCSGLTSVTIGNSVTSIGGSAFYGCSGLECFIVGEDSETYASQDGVLYNKVKTRIIDVPQAIKGNITLPDSVTSIGGSAFSGRSGLTSVTIGNGVTSIGGYAFSECRKLTSVTIPNGVTTIGDSAFYRCSGLTSVRYTGDLASWCGISGLGNLMGDGSADRKLFINEKEITGELVIPDGVTSIGDYAFLRCIALTSVTIPDGVTSIGDGAFRGCSGLTSVTIPNSVTSIGEYTFYGCSGLTSVTIPDSVTSIGKDAFSGCSRLERINYQGGVDQWQTFPHYWNSTTGNYTVYCTDGSILPDGTVTKN